MRREVLIERYIPPTEINQYGTKLWFDEDGYLYKQERKGQSLTASRILVEYFNKHGELERNKNKPAYITYDKNGYVCYKSWYKNGKHHRDGGFPARVWHDKCGKIKEVEFWIDGEFIKHTKIE